MALPKTKVYTVDEFEVFLAKPENRDRHFELINGEIVEKPVPTDEHAFITGLLIYYLTDVALKHGLGLPGPERRFVFPGDTHQARQPDVSLILDPDVPLVTKGPMRLIPDVVVEVMSPDDSPDDLRDKAKFYMSQACGWYGWCFRARNWSRFTVLECRCLC